jgi:hypothetical protein
MKVRLLESAHDIWAPAGTVGEIEKYNNLYDGISYRFIPDNAKDHPLWIGLVKWEEVVETAETVKPRKRGK